MRSLSGKKFLIIDDEPDVCEIIASAFDLEGGATLSASNIDLAIEALAQPDIDLICLDLNIPGGGAKKIIATLNSRAAATRPKIFLVTGDSVLLSEFPSIDRVIAKPFAVQDLVAQATEVLTKPDA